MTETESQLIGIIAKQALSIEALAKTLENMTTIPMDQESLPDAQDELPYLGNSGFITGGC